MKVFGPEKFQIPSRESKWQIRNRQFGTFDSLHGINIFLAQIPSFEVF
jgi:hypothetical protein